MSVTARAPGKLFVTGEYAVLAGAPALVAAVDRHARVTLTPGDAGGLVVESLAEGRFVTDDPFRGALPGGDAGAVLAAWRAVSARGPRPPHAAHVEVDSRAFVIGERKLGLGRSAATLAAAAAALLDERAPRDDVLATALAANALFQDGHGSGGDVAAAVHGGLVEVRRTGAAPAIASRRLPGGLRLIAGWTGSSAHTAPLLARFATLSARTPGALDALKAAAEDGAAAVAEGDASGLLEAVRRSARLLAALGEVLDLPIMTPALRRLVDAAARLGIAAKPSGAGAGDCGIAFVTSEREAAELSLAWRREGIEPLTLGIANDGVARG
jgi:phosphomevalonate kinase